VAWGQAEQEEAMNEVLQWVFIAFLGFLALIWATAGDQR
jgi:hypothetical protein